ncbi:hypothetical protein [Raineya orbicola]|jgi:hypothetical protein|uniref:Outer membrane protein beta-barrel domain n=1 Tax=Raineya orbicola TaxID=2016530 RepID=A0A2N3IIL4_9BACT|nr:hypothetical protein [Raineya orbicola]PKQ70154.1 hypothetical protein Rain11_0814 [Raineya orbicola]
MRKVLFFITFVSIFQAFAQEEGEDYSRPRKVVVGGVASQDFYYSQFARRAMYGLAFQYFVGRKVSLNNRLMFGINPDQKLMLHYGLGGLMTHAIVQGGGGFILISGNLAQDILGLIILPVIIPEGIQFHFGGEYNKISPYIYPASFEYRPDILNQNELKAILEAGVQFRFSTKKHLVIAPSIAWKYRYGDSLQALSLGLMIGFE